MKVGLLALLLLALPSPSRADMWCASPLVVHEWGVHVYGQDGVPIMPVALPPWFHTRRGPAAATTPVKLLPADSGIRTLPVLHFYGQTGATIPVGVEVAFTGGEPGVWYPGVDRIDQNRLVWDRLELTTKPRTAPLASDLDWVGAARALAALWVERRFESERFVFYEAATQERVPLTLRRDKRWTPTRRAMVIENFGRHPVHDVFLVHREGKRAFAFRVPVIDPGKAVAFTVEDHPLATDLRRELHALLDAPAPAIDAPAACVTGRDPAVATSRASGHRIYKDEVDLILSIWGQRFFDTQGTSILYREGTPQLDEVMPLSIYTDMYHFIELRRAGLALWQGLTL